MEDGRKKLNTVFHYQVCMCVYLYETTVVGVVMAYLYIPDIVTATAGVFKVRIPYKWCHWLSMGGRILLVSMWLYAVSWCFFLCLSAVICCFVEVIYCRKAVAELLLVQYTVVMQFLDLDEQYTVCLCN